VRKVSFTVLILLVRREARTIDALSPSRGGRIIVILPVSEETQKRRKDVKIEFSVVYTLIGFALKFAHALEVPAIPEDKSATLEYVSTVMPRVIENWKAGEGSPKFKTQRLRHLQGGLEKIHEGLEIMRDGKYGREKLVYTIA